MFQLFIEGVELDVDYDEDVVTTHALNKIGDITARDGVYSNVFKLPKTERNIRTLKMANVINGAGRIQYKRSSMIMKTDGLTLEGFGTITAVDSKINVRFMASNYDWGDLIGDRKLSDFDYQEANHEWTSVNILASRVSDTMPYAYPNADYGFGNIEDNDRTPQYLRPWYRVPYIVKSIFKNVGFIFYGEIEADEIYSQSIVFKGNGDLIAFNPEDIDLSLLAPQVIPTQAVIIPPSSYDRINLSAINTAWDNTLRQFTVPQWGDYKFTLNVTFLDGAPTDYVGRIEVDTLFGSGLLVSTYFGNGYGGLNNAQIEVTSTLIAGEVVIFNVAALTALYPQMTIEAFAKIELIKVYPQDGQFVDASFMMPDMKAKDFLKSVFMQFGLIVNLDMDGAVKASRYDDIIDNIGNAVDYSQKLSLSDSENIEYSLGYAQKNNLKYKPDAKDELLSRYPNYGEGSFLVNDENAELEKELYVSSFSAILRRRAFVSQIGAIQEAAYIPIGVFDDNGVRVENTINPKIGYIKRDNSCILLTGGPTVNQPQIYFEEMEWPNLINKGYELITTALTDTVVLKAEFLISGVDLQNLDFLKPLFLKPYNSYFYIDSVNQFNHTKKITTSFTLVKIAP